MSQCYKVGCKNEECRHEIGTCPLHCEYCQRAEDKITQIIGGKTYGKL